MNQRLIVIAGPTASGKSSVAVQIAKALHGEVLCADSMQLYRNMDIGTAKITEQEMQGVPHHMLSVLDPCENNTVSGYTEAAVPVIRALQESGVPVIVCGGTGMYIDALIRPMRFGVPGDEAVREKLRLFLEAHGKRALHERLEKVDPESAKRLHENDTRRVLRALEVFEVSGVTLSRHNAMDAQKPPLFEGDVYALRHEKASLHERINARVDDMIEKGLETEVRRLLSDPQIRASTAMQAIGYKEMAEYVDGLCTFDQAVDNIKYMTRSYAKRQITWLKREESTQWIAADDRDAVDIAKEIIRRHYERA